MLKVITERKTISGNEKIRFTIKMDSNLIYVSGRISSMNGKRFIVISSGYLPSQVADGQTEGNTLELEIDPE